MEVSNVKAMREALEKAQRVLHCAIVAGILKGEDAVGTLNAVNAAISAPPRNCDVGTAEDQADRFYAFCEGRRFQSGIKGMCSSLCPCISCRDMCHCIAKWSQMPYEEGGAK